MSLEDTKSSENAHGEAAASAPGKEHARTVTGQYRYLGETRSGPPAAAMCHDPVVRRKLMPPARHCLEKPSGELWVESAANLAVSDALPSHLVQPVHEQLAKKYSRWRVAMSLLAIAGPVCSTACMVSGTSLWRWGRCAPMTV